MSTTVSHDTESADTDPARHSGPTPAGAYRQSLIEGLSRVAVVVEEHRSRSPLLIEDRRERRGGEPRGRPAGETATHRQSRSLGNLRPNSAPTLDIIVRQQVSAVIERVRIAYGFLDPPDESPANIDAHALALSDRLGHAFKHELRTGLKVLLIALVLGGGWAVLVPISGAVVVPGNLVTETNIKKVQHPTGGIVAQILVHDGVHVKQGDMLARLDETTARTNNQLVSQQLDQTRARIARLLAERDGLDEPQFPTELTSRGKNEDVARLLASEKSLFKARAAARQSHKELLRTRITQLGEEIGGIKSQIKSKEEQLTLISSELTGVQSLFEKHLVPLTRLTNLQREAARIEGERGQLTSALAETQSKIGEAELQILQLDKDFRTEVTKDLREAQDKESDLAEKSVAARDQLNRINIRAPTAGVVQQMSIHTVGGVVGPGEVLMSIVPDADGLQIEARLPPNDIDQVYLGQKTVVRLSAFNQRTTPQLAGVVSYVSADASQDQHTNASYYTVRVTLPEEEHRRLGDLQLVSGMPAEVFLQTGSRTMLSYLFKPITDQLQRMFRER